MLCVPQSIDQEAHRSDLGCSGSGFVSGLTVSISGGFTVNSTTFVNSGELKVKVTAGNNGQTGKYDLTVTNPDGGSNTSENSVENT